MADYRWRNPVPKQEASATCSARIAHSSVEEPPSIELCQTLRRPHWDIPTPRRNTRLTCRRVPELSDPIQTLRLQPHPATRRLSRATLFLHRNGEQSVENDLHCSR